MLCSVRRVERAPSRLYWPAGRPLSSRSVHILNYIFSYTALVIVTFVLFLTCGGTLRPSISDANPEHMLTFLIFGPIAFESTLNVI